ncbi:Uncharacterised protein [Bordetella pertussis]|nr:Uncharacterised protein [Bordetella pertussis]
MAASAAATVRMKNTNTWPAMSPNQLENATKFMLTARSTSSMDISRMIRLRRLRKMPKMPMAKRIAPRIR